MAPKHDEIVKDLGEGWSMAWDTNEVDRKTREAIDAVVQQNAESLRQIIADAETGVVQIDGKSVRVLPEQAEDSAA
jgi:hypothetical protein